MKVDSVSQPVTLIYIFPWSLHVCVALQFGWFQFVDRTEVGLSHLMMVWYSTKAAMTLTVK